MCGVGKLAGERSLAKLFDELGQLGVRARGEVDLQGIISRCGGEERVITTLRTSGSSSSGRELAPALASLETKQVSEASQDPHRTQTHFLINSRTSGV